MKVPKSFNLNLAILLSIFLLALFFRSYNLKDFMGFALDADLYSWIVKDILVDKHIRLVGQMTSEQGVYVGPLFYYLLIPFFILTGMDPFGSAFFGVVVGVTTVLSIYLVFKKLINEQAGLIAAFLQSVLPLRVGFDRWIVPTILTNLWCVWYFYFLIKITKGDRKYIFFTSFLIGLIWHIHLALTPLIILLPLAIILSKKLPDKKTFLLSGIVFLLPMLPFFAFELRHDFIQINSILKSFSDSKVLHLERIVIVLNQSISENNLIKIILLFLPLSLFIFKVINKNVLIIIYSWIFSVITFFIFSSKQPSEYYFTSIQTIYLFTLIFLLSDLIKFKKIGFALGLLTLAIIFIYSFNNLVNLKDDDNGYSEKKAAAQFIKDNVVSKNIPCYSITFINNPGENTGFKYLFWYLGLKPETPASGIPNYTLVIPSSLSRDSIEKNFGTIGVILNKFEYNEQTKCTGFDQNLNEPLWGFTN